MKQKNTHKTILIAAPERALLEVLAGCLSRLGLEVVTAHSHRELRWRCRRGDYGLIISRFVTPLVASPGEVARLRGRGRHTPLFILSHTRDERVVVTLLERGVSQFLSLPVSSERLVRKVAGVVLNRRPLC